MKNLSLAQLRAFGLALCAVLILVAAGIFIAVGLALGDLFGLGFILISLAAIFCAIWLVDPRE